MRLTDWFSVTGKNKRKKRKTVTAVLCNYNHASSLERSLKAYVTQKRRPDRLIAWDDCSTDESMQIIEKIRHDNPWVEVVRNPKNVGHILNCAIALQACQTDYIYFGASDDLIYPNLFDCAMSLLERYPEAGVFCSNYAMRDVRSESITHYTIPLGKVPRFIGSDEFLGLIQNESAFVFPSHTIVMKVEDLRKAGGFIPGFGARIDWFYQLVISFRTGVVFSPSITAEYTVGQEQTFSGAHLASKATDYECMSRMLDLLSSASYQDVCDKFFTPAVLRGAPGMLPRLAGMIDSEARYEPFKRYSIIRKTIDELCGGVGARES